MKYSAPHTPRKAHHTGNNTSRDLLLGIAAASPSGYFFISAAFSSIPILAWTVLLMALLTVGFIWNRNRSRKNEDAAPLLTESEIEHDLIGAPAPPTSI